MKAAANANKTVLHEGLNHLLEKVYSDRGWDFRGYKRSTLGRRVSKLMQASRSSDIGEYSSMLDSDPSEYDRLFSTLTIKVSEFFREPEVFSVLAGVLGSELARSPVKAWCCGCAHGEEAYSLGMMLSEKMAPGALAESRIFATDIDGDAMEHARKALYRHDSIANVPEALRRRYMTTRDGLYGVSQELRALVRFGTLDIVRSPSIKGVNILFCRNLFIYFSKPLQEAVFEKLDYSLKPGGILVMGKAEVLPSRYSDRYLQVGRGINLYRKAS